MKVGICIGHSRNGDNGAVSVGGVSEWTYNVKVGELLASKLASSPVDCILITDYAGGSYGSAMNDVANKLAQAGTDLAIELHFNSAGQDAAGFEYLYWHTSQNGSRMAGELIKAHEAAVPHGSNRGAKPRDSSDRGAGFLSGTHCPAIITEPFFGSNINEWDEYGTDVGQELLASIYATAILQYYGVTGSEPMPEPPTTPPSDSPIDKAAIMARVESIEWQCQELRKDLE